MSNDSDPTLSIPGIGRIADTFARAKEGGRAALMPYFTLGYPSRSLSIEIIEAIDPYCDFLELGVPFSDPIADGPTIQRSTQSSLEAGTTVATCFEMVSQMRDRGVATPSFLMGYYNPILAYGEERYVRDAVDVGVDGFIVPDLPPEESGTFQRHVTDAGLGLIHFLAPTSNAERIRLVLSRAEGFVYLVSVTGVTGARRDLDTNLPDFVSSIRQRAKVPVAVGFGISTVEQAASVGEFADGVIVGSALINAVNRAGNKPLAAELFVRDLLRGLQGGAAHRIA